MVYGIGFSDSMSFWCLQDFFEAQGKRLKFSPELRANLDGIFSEMSQCVEKGQVQPKSAMAADIVSIGDSWLSYAIRKGLLEPIKNAEEQDWFHSLSGRWKVRSEAFLFLLMMNGY